MTLAEVDWGVLRRPLLVLVLALVVSSLFAAGAYYYTAGVSRAHRAESSRLTSSRALSDPR